MFDKAAHSRLRDAAPPKNLHRIPCRILRAPCAIHLQESDLAGSSVGNSLVPNCLFLISLRLHPSLTGRTLASRCYLPWDGKKVAGLDLSEGWKCRWWPSSKQQS